MLNHHMVIYGPKSWVQYSMRGEHEQTLPAPETAPYDDVNWEILCKSLIGYNEGLVKNESIAVAF